MNDKIDIALVGESQPWFFHERVPLQNPPITLPAAKLPYGYMNFKIDFGFNYLLRRMRTHFAEFDQVGALPPVNHTQFLPTMNIEITEKAFNIIPQNVPIPIDLTSTPASSGTTLDPTGVLAYDQLTASAPKADKLINKLFKNGSNIEIFISGNAALATTFPMYVHIVLIGYLIPAKKLDMWGTNG
jgi:hypothetical protein